MNWELPEVQAGFTKERGRRDQTANIHWTIEKARKFQKNIYFCFIDYAKAFDCADTTNCGKFLKRWEYQTTLPASWELYAGQEATVKTGHGTTDWFKTRKGLHQGCILSPCLFNLYAEYIMQNAGLDESQAGIKVAGRNINNDRYAEDITLMAESKEELKSLFMKVREWKSWLKSLLSKGKMMTSSPITSWQIDGETMETVTDCFWLQNHCRWWLQPWN